MQTQRGCPLACEFCGAPLLGAFPREARRQFGGTGGRSRPSCLGRCWSWPTTTPSRGRDRACLEAVAAGSRQRYFTECDWRLGRQPRGAGGRLPRAACRCWSGIESLVFRRPAWGPTRRRGWARMLDAVRAARRPASRCWAASSWERTARAGSLDRLAGFLADAAVRRRAVDGENAVPGDAASPPLSAGGAAGGRGWEHYTLFDVTYQPDRLSVGELEEGFRGVVREAFEQRATARRQGIRKETWRRHPRLGTWTSGPPGVYLIGDRQAKRERRKASRCLEGGRSSEAGRATLSRPRSAGPPFFVWRLCDGRRFPAASPYAGAERQGLPGYNARSGDRAS